jgi:NADPH:quinone reductase-like Zn-dependent oxidoreductase
VGLNHLDLWVRKGVEGHQFPLPIIPGCDIAGETMESGRRVLVNPILSCGKCRYCRSGADNLCPEFGIIGETTHGGLAEVISVPRKNLIPLPRSVPFETAAALPIAYVTAWTMLKHRARLRRGEWILIHAAGSGVSIACIQIARLLNTNVVVTARDEWKLDAAKKIGAHHGIDLSKGSFRNQLREILKPKGLRGVGIVVDHVGADTFSESLKCLDWGGRIVTCGATSGSDVTVNLKPVFFKSLSILGSTMGSKADVVSVLNLVARKRIRPVIHSVFDFNRANQAFALLESRRIFGKVVITNSAH